MHYGKEEWESWLFVCWRAGTFLLRNSFLMSGLLSSISIKIYEYIMKFLFGKSEPPILSLLVLVASTLSLPPLPAPALFPKKKMVSVVVPLLVQLLVLSMIYGRTS